MAFHERTVEIIEEWFIGAFISTYVRDRGPTLALIGLTCDVNCT